ncbi:ABC transporter substrate-binding protein [Frankia sp. CNm7]|uniref:ABC transporter substrate-binding protein n=1 Tax=Frankia nepalensis TaxID=1836974 RepID=A0A937RHK7_9ACTN|nr:ABC transporter substrate-binding protein [Frankia nepalensis]MBL7496516.1 ABC transporter substrate-binding protein [Frankia nepalensis]MBL7508735.1 ABC transporter substrate-binding protein [Frankia nepalensis]MBL7523802.1 ABC transporter substrate-binding protein [Frankia nepalensis]MBL7627489.1 ABC transporter substrate-binding protein [Frankia nepalensis]
MWLPVQKRLVRGAALAASASTLAVGLAACGQAGSGTAGGVSCDASVPGVTNENVKLGLTWSDTGDGAASLAAFRGGIDARLELANANGEVFGREITYAWRDDQADQELNARVTRELVEDEGVFGMMTAPGGAGGSIEWLAEQGIPVTGMGSDPLWQNRGNMFSFYYLGEGSNTAWGKLVRERGGTRAAVLTISGSKSNSDFSRQLAASLLESGIEIVKTYQVAEAVTNFEAIAQQIKANDIDTLAGVVLPNIAIKLLPALRARGVELKAAVLPLGYDDNILQKDGKNLANAIIVNQVKPWQANTPEQQAFLEAMNTYSPQIQPATTDTAVNGYVAADLFVEGLKLAGQCPSRESFIAALRAVTSYQGAGLIPKEVDLSTNYKEPNSCYSVVQIIPDGAAFVPLFGAAPLCGDPITPERMNQLLGAA